MTDVPTCGPGEPTAQQCEIVTAPPSARILVTAGAGTGKTLVLAERLGHLVDSCGLLPGTELLVLSFSRAAVNEIRRRTKGRTDGTSYVSAKTFDAFATHFLAWIDPDGSWNSGGYEDRIRAATQAIQELSEELPIVLRPKHILIDEIQDLVGTRAELVLALLARCDCGFTLFGDPAQSIYGHQIRGEADAIDNRGLYARLRGAFADSLIEKSLTENFRALSDSARGPLRFGPRLQEADADYDAVLHDIETEFLNLESVGDLTPMLPALGRKQTGTTAILCRTNGQALIVSRRLAESQIPHRLQREASERIVAGWVARSLLFQDSPRTSRARFLERVDEMPLEGRPSPEEMWDLLKFLEGRRNDDLDCRIVQQRVSIEAVPEELHVDEELPIVVSSIHRAKGLEFDRVVIVQPDPCAAADEDISEETRLLYVALSRTRDELYVMDRPETRNIRRLPAAGRRWARFEYRGRRRRTAALEVRGRDVHAFDPAGAYMVEGCDVKATQDYIWNGVKPCDPVTLTLERESNAGEPRAYYAVRHGGQVVGCSSDEFAAILHRALGGGEVRWPETIAGLRVESVDTAAGSTVSGRESGLGASGMWLRVRVSGLGDFV